MMNLLRMFVGLLVFLTLWQACVAEEISLRVVCWNVESGDAKASVIAQRLEEEDGVDIWGLSEVQNDSDLKKFEELAESDEGADFKRILGTTGGSDRLAIIYNSDRLRVVETEELHQMNIGGNVRSPLVTHFKGKTTGKEFLFMGCLEK